jgi:hypothetical protein
MSPGSDKQSAAISFILKFILVVLALITLFRGEYVWFIGVIFVLILVNFPAILARDFSVKLPIIFDLAITVSVFLHVIGGYVDFYEFVPGYDNVTHFISSMTVSLIGLTLLYIIVFHFENTRLPPLFFGIFTVMFAMSMGVIWEFLEWGFDLAFKTELQRGLQDTMRDFMFDTLAGLVVGIVATVRLKTGVAFEKGEIEIGDITSSVGYQRWKTLTDKNIDLKEKIRLSFKDPLILEQLFDYIVKESKEISEREKKLWHGLKKAHKDAVDKVCETIPECEEIEEKVEEKLRSSKKAK